MYGIKDAGFEAYLVGGGVRDLLLGSHPKDFDIVTNAQPEEVHKLFRSCILIGRRFRLAHIRFGREVIEVATFRAGATEHTSDRYQYSEHGMILRDNVYGTIEEDAWRRDFTVNSLYYRIKDFSVIDYTGGMKDLKTKTIRMIGDPIVRYREDPVRMLRAIRLAAKLGFTITKNTADPITKLAPLLINISPARLLEEVIKWFRSGKSLETFNLLKKYKLLPYLFAQSTASLQGKNSKNITALLHHGFNNTDQRINAGKTIIPAFLYAVLLWWPLQEQIKILRQNEKISESTAIQHAILHVLQLQKKQTLIPQKMLFTIKNIWMMQHQLIQKKKRKIYYLLAHPRFRAAYDFLLLRAQAGEQIKEYAKWWTLLQEASELKRCKIIAKYTGEPCQIK